MQKLVTSTHEQDGRFALKLESKRAVKRDLKRSEEIHNRRQQVRTENAEWAKANNVSESDLDMLFM